MKKLLLLTAAVLGLSATAYAGEGNGEPFPPPDIGVTTRVENPKYTMGSQAPFNYVVPSTPTSMKGYVQAPPASQDPYPFKSAGRVIQMQPTAPTAVARTPDTRSGPHG
ncbi:MAG TPA: hypothetical protein VE650_05995 [Acetobacteraceae bacterium]|jgi:hypothetical protein|nr:hypothetical protein [Acetobacteraceae bacterium]